MYIYTQMFLNTKAKYMYLLKCFKIYSIYFNLLKYIYQ